MNETVRSWIPQRQKRQLLFLRNHGRWGNFKDPRTFSEKVNWRILNDRRPELAWTGDKLDMKDRAAAVGVRPETYWQGENVSTLAGFTARPLGTQTEPPVVSWSTSAVANPTSTSCGRLTVGWTDETQSKVLGEWAYSQARRCCWWRNSWSRGGTPLDYKFFVMDGKAEIIQVDVDRFGDHRRNVYTPEWEPVDTQYLHPRGDVRPATGQACQRWCTAAERIAGDLDFLRVDLYNIGGEIYLGEVAAYPGSGLERHRPYAYDVQLGTDGGYRMTCDAYRSDLRRDSSTADDVIDCLSI